MNWVNVAIAFLPENFLLAGIVVLDLEDMRLRAKLKLAGFFGGGNLGVERRPLGS